MQARHYRPEVARFMSRDRYESSALDYELESDPLTNNLYAFAGGNPVGNVEWDGHYFTGSDCHDNGLPGPSEFDRHCKGKKHHAIGGGDGCGGRPCVLVPAPAAGNSESFKNSAVLKRATEQAVMQKQLAAQNAAFAASMNADYALQQKIGRVMAPLGVIAMALAPHPAECGAGGDFKAGGCGMEVLNLFPPAKITRAGKVIKAVDDARDVGRGAKAGDDLLDAKKLISPRVAATFANGTMRVHVLEKETLLFRRYGGRASELGPFWSKTQYVRPGNARRYLALPPENSADRVIGIRVPAGTLVIEGKAAGQSKWGFPGGGNQIVFPENLRIPRSWID